ncbi:putative bacteriocin [Streptococcus pneumoniae GA56348]|nr:putative bacteriocin [Streptococcus pneumoniae GA56348]
MGVEPLRIMQNLRHGLELPSPRFRQQEWNISMDLSKILPSPIWRGKTVVEALL